VGTAFAFSRESGLRQDLKNRLVSKASLDAGRVFTDPLASPTGYPFKVAQLEGTLSDAIAYNDRNRICDLGFLREAYATPEGPIGYRCSAEPASSFIQKGGEPEAAIGRKCLCNALLANIGHAQIRRDGTVEPPLVTVGDDLNKVAQFLSPGQDSYSAAEVIQSMLGTPSTNDSPEEAADLQMA
jgi:nitronate monooxygenase